MRYIIIPLGIILYILWTIVSIKDIKNSGRWYRETDVTTIWRFFTIVSAIITLVVLSILYW